MQKKYEEVIAWIRGELREGRLKQGTNFLKTGSHPSASAVKEKSIE